MRNKNIGIFDSGFGGLTILSALRKKLPEYNYIYLGDTQNAPYGNKSKEEVHKLTLRAVRHLFDQSCELVVLACNTASSDALRKVQQELQQKEYPDRRALGVVIPTCEFAVAEGDKKIGVMATTSTVESGSYVREIKKLDEKAEIIQVACPKIVPLIEAGFTKNKALDEALAEYAKVFKEEKPDSVILGCTHYEIVGNEIAKALGDIKIIKQSEIVADKLKDYLGRHNDIAESLGKNKKLEILTTGDVKKFQPLAELILEHQVQSRKIVI